MKRREDLTNPRRRRRPSLGIYYDPEAFGQFSEAIARYLGTARFLVIQTGIVIVWITLNVLVVTLRWDKYPFILLNLAFSTQAAYAAPLILLAQNRQEARDSAQIERDRDLANRTQADTEYLARELAAVRLVLGDVASQADVGDLTKAIGQLNDRLDALLAPGDDGAKRAS